MKDNKKLLTNDIALFIEVNIVNKQVVNETISYAVESIGKYFSDLKLDQIFKNNIPLEMLTDYEVCNLARYLKKNYNYDVDMSQWFTDEELQNSQNDYVEVNVRDKELIFENVIFDGNKDKPTYKCFISWKKLAALENESRLSYNTDTQRIGETASRGYSSVTIPKIEGGAVDNIAKLVSEEKFGSNDIILNSLRVDEENPFRYQNGILRINSKTLDIVDGAHRVYGITKGIKINPDAEGVIGVTIVNLDTEEAGNLVYQIAMTNEHNKELLTKYDSSNRVTQFIKQLNYAQNVNDNFLYMKIEQYNGQDKASTIIRDKTLRETLILGGIKEFLETTSKTTMREFVDYTVEFYALFSDLFKATHQEQEKLLESDTFLSFLMFTCYKMYRNGITLSIKNIQKVVDSFDFENNKYNHVLAITKKQHQKMMKLFNGLV